VTSILIEESIEQSETDFPEMAPPNADEISARIRELEIEAGIWLSSCASFAEKAGVTRISRSINANAAPAMARVLHAGLSRVSLVTSQIHASEVMAGVRSERHAKTVFHCLRDMVAMGDPSWDRPFSASEFISWCGLVNIGLNSTSISVDHFVRAAELEGGSRGVGMLDRLSADGAFPVASSPDLRLIMRKFGMIFQYLDVIEQLMDRDEPLKPGVLIFARIELDCRELLTLMEGRAAALRGTDERLADAIDGAAYIASIETKKVFDHELAGILEIRPVPAVFARFEAAHALLKEGFQQTIASIGQQFNENIDALAIYPSLKTKRDNSFALREEMQSLARAVAAAEASPESPAADEMRMRLAAFLAGPVRYLFFKDIETVERFAEEIELATSEDELQPILHRFSAFLETLIGQVGLRAVLAEEGGPQASL
jgi:hypothetical protein